MQFAFGITAYDSNQEPIDDPTYGNVVARYASWGLGEGPGTTISDPIPMKECSDADLGITVGPDGGENNLDRSATRFYPAHASNIGDLTFFRKKL